MESGYDPVDSFSENTPGIDGTSVLGDVVLPSNIVDATAENMLLASNAPQTNEVAPCIDDASVFAKGPLQASSAVISDDAVAPMSNMAFPELAVPPADDIAVPNDAVLHAGKDTAVERPQELGSSSAIEKGGVSTAAVVPLCDVGLPSSAGSSISDTALNGESETDEGFTPVDDWDAELRTIIRGTENGKLRWQRGLKMLAGALLDSRQKQCAVSTSLQDQVNHINDVETATITLANKIKLFEAELSAHTEELKRELAKKQSVDKANEDFDAIKNAHADFQRSLQRCDDLLTRTEASKARLDNAASNAVESFKRTEKTERKLVAIETRTNSMLLALVDDVKKLKTKGRQVFEHGNSTEHHQRGSDSVVESADFKALQARVALLESLKITQAISTLAKKIHDSASKCQLLDQAMGSRVAQLREEAADRSMNHFRQKWTETQKKRLWKLVQNFLSGWFAYSRRINAQKASVLQGMVRMQRLLMQRRVVPRFRTWWYASQKDLHTKEFERLTEFTNTIHTQVTQMAAGNTKKEKAQADQMENIVYRAVSLESRVESISTRKADAIAVKEQMVAMQNSIIQACDMDRLQRMIKDVDEKFRPLEKKKADLSIVEMQTSRLNKLSFDMARNFTRLEDELRTRATKGDFKDKADSKTVEKALVMLSSQMDRLTRISGHDMENFRSTLIQYLELSPDLRKAALSLGIKPNEDCLTCKSGQKDGITLPIRGKDDKLYQNMSAVNQQRRQTGTKQLVDRSLRTPTRLGSAIGGRKLDIPSPANPMSEDTISMDQILHTTFADAEDTKPKTQNERCSSIKLFFRGAVAPEKDGADPTPRRPFRLEKQGARPKSRSGSALHPPIERPSSVMSESEDDINY